MHTTNLHLFFGAVLLSTAVTGCAVRAGGRAYVSGPSVEVSPPVVFVEPPPLVAIEQDVYVVRDYDTPVYYVGDSYWLYRGGVWYRADDWNAGWVTVQVHAVPSVIIHRDHHRYVRYHGPAHAEVRTSVTLRGSAKVQSRGRQVRQQPAYKRSPPRRDVRKPAAHPGYARERAAPQRRPRYDQPVQRQPVRGRDVVKQPQRQQPRGHERRDDRKPKKGGGRR